MIEYQSGAPGEEHPDDTTGELSVGRSVLPERVLLTGRSRGARRAVQLSAALALVFAVVALVLYSRRDSGAPTALPTPTSSVSASPAAQALSPLDQVMALAATTHFATNIRQSSNNRPCPAVKPGHDPTAAVAAVVTGSIPSARVTGTTRTIDQFTGLCALNVVLTDSLGNRVIISVAAPTTVANGAFDAQQVGLQDLPDGRVEYALVGWRTGWRVLVGAVGRSGQLVTTTELSAVANSPNLLW